MRPVAKSNSALKTPLNEILGYPGNVRILRCLMNKKISMSYGELADQSGISIPGVHKAVDRLIKTGILAYQGSGKRQLITSREQHPLFYPLSECFNAETERFESLKNRLKQEVGNMKVKPVSAWMYGKTVQGVDQYGDPLQIALLGSPSSIDDLTDQFKECVADSKIESTFDVTIQINGITQADLDADHKTIAGGTDLLWGMAPIFFAEGYRSSAGSKTHGDLDAQSLQAGKALGKLLTTYPEIVARTIRHLESRISETDSGVKGELTEWKQLLESASLQRLIKLLVSEGERATRMRQSNPFWQVLTEGERQKLVEVMESLAT
jgi:hypothetical protein